MTDDLLEAVLAPRSIAVIGASENIHKIGGRPLNYMLRQGYRGHIYPVNPLRDQVQGLRSYGTLADVPEAPDLALVIVAGQKAVEAVDECAARGVKAAIVVAAGFGETGEEGRETQSRMVASARRSGMRIIGPNSQGFANFSNGAIASFSTMFTEVAPQDGAVAVVSQSGGMCAMVYGLLRGQGIGVRHVHATGNEADVNVAGVAWAVAHDPGVKLLLLYLENIADPALLARTAAYARERGLPIVAVKAGRTASGQKAASSHTGSLANEDRVVDAFFQRHGIWRVRDPHELALAAPAYLKGWKPQGRRLVVISNSGASCVMGADAAETLELPLAQLSDRTREDVAARLPGFATASNPIDITAALLTDSDIFADVLPMLGRDPAADLFFINIPVAGAGYDLPAFARDTAKLEASTGKPVVVAAWQERVAEPFRELGVATFANEAQALQVLDQVTAHTALAGRPVVQWPADAAPELPQGPSRFLNEAQSLELLGKAGVPIVEHRLCRSAAEVRAAFEAIGGPVAVKACSVGLPHKSESGLVALGVATAADATRIFEAQWARMGELAELGVPRDGVIVAAMHKGRHEFMVGAHLDPVFGPVVVVGDGGKYVEALQDVALLVPPFDAADVKAAVRGLRIGPLLDGLRGEPPMDIDALAAIAVAAGRVIVAARGRIASIDINPVMLGDKRTATAAADALVERAPTDQHTETPT